MTILRSANVGGRSFNISLFYMCAQSKGVLRSFNFPYVLIYSRYIIYDRPPDKKKKKKKKSKCPSKNGIR